MFMSVLGTLLMKSAPRCLKVKKKTVDFCTFHIDTQHRPATPIDAPQGHLSQIPSVYKHFASAMVRSARELSPPRKWQLKEDRRDGWGAPDFSPLDSCGTSSRHRELLTRVYHGTWTGGR